MKYNQEERDILLKSAKDSIIFGITNHNAPSIQLNNYPAHLLEPNACFVTIHKNKALRGCIGSLQATQPLIADVIANAYRAAFQDPRFHPLQATEIPNIHIDISVLSTPEPLTVTSEADLLQKLTWNFWVNFGRCYASRYFSTISLGTVTKP